MKLSKTFPLLGLSVCGLAGSSAAAALLDTIVAAIQQSDKDTVALNAAFLAFTGDIGPVSAAARTLVANVVRGRQQIAATPGADLVTDDVLNLSAYVSALYTDSETLVATLTAAKPALEAGGFCATVRRETADISSASGALIDGITKRVNPADRPAAGAVSGLITEQLAKAEAVFRDCEDESPPKSTATSTSKATSSASSTGTTSSGGATTSTGTTSTGTTSTGATSSTGTGTKTGTSSTGKSSTATSSTGTASSGTTVTTGTGTGTGITTPCASTTGTITSSRWSNSTATTAPSGSVTVTTICTTTAAATTSGSGCKTCPSGGNGNGGNGNGGNGNGGNGNGGNGNGGNGNGGSGGNGNGNAPPTTNSGNLMAPAGALALAIAALVF